MNAAALIVVMEIDDVLGAFVGQGFSSEPNFLKVRVKDTFFAWNNMNSILLLISFSTAAIFLQLFLTDVHQGFYFVAIKIIILVISFLIQLTVNMISGKKK